MKSATQGVRVSKGSGLLAVIVKCILLIAVVKPGCFELNNDCIKWPKDLQNKLALLRNFAMNLSNGLTTGVETKQNKVVMNPTFDGLLIDNVEAALTTASSHTNFPHVLFFFGNPLWNS